MDQPRAVFSHEKVFVLSLHLKKKMKKKIRLTLVLHESYYFLFLSTSYGGSIDTSDSLPFFLHRGPCGVRRSHPFSCAKGWMHRLAQRGGVSTVPGYIRTCVRLLLEKAASRPA